jgi:hypothetical protein
MKVKCIDDGDGSWAYILTVGKIYAVIREDIFTYKIINDNCYHTSCPKRLFKTLSEIRNEKIDKLLDQ